MRNALVRPNSHSTQEADLKAQTRLLLTTVDGHRSAGRDRNKPSTISRLSLKRRKPSALCEESGDEVLTDAAKEVCHRGRYGGDHRVRVLIG